MQKIMIDPITRLEGHGKIAIFLDDGGNVAESYLQIPEFRGFEKFCQGRPVEEVPRIVPRICGVWPLVHHFAGAKAVDNVYNVELSPTGEKLRRLIYNSYMYYDHMLHFYYLAAPDFVVGPDAPAAERNILGVIGKVGLEVGKTVIDRRAKAIDVMKYFGGKRTHPIISLPGGVSRQLEEEYRQTMVEQATEAVEFTKFTLQVFEDVVLKNKAYLDLVLSEAYGGQETYYIGLVTDDNKVDFYDGFTRIVDPEGKEFAKYEVKDYLNYLEEHVEPWTYLKTTYLKDIGWKGFVTGKDSGIYRGGPLGRLNAADGMQTPLAQAEYEKFYDTLGGKPVHATLAYHWARLVEMMQGAELWLEFAKDESTTAPDVRNIPKPLTGPSEGVGTIEAARGHLIHHYWTDENGITTDVNLIVATTHNYAGINIACRNAAKALIKDGQVNDGLLNMVEMAFRAYDPCFACATHSLPGQLPLEAVIYEADGSVYKRLKK